MPNRRHFLACACAAAMLAPLMPFGPAAAHHGWSWTTGKNIELTGVITETRLGMPHGELVMEVEGTSWTVEVGQPYRNERSGLKEGDLAKGMTITVSGEPSADPDEKLLKVERLWIGERKYELYPNRD